MKFYENSNIVSAQDYYPYGEILRSYTLGSGAYNKFFFTEKERDTETNYDYFACPGEVPKKSERKRSARYGVYSDENRGQRDCKMANIDPLAELW